MMAMHGFSGARLGLCTRNVLRGGRRMGLWRPVMSGYWHLNEEVGRRESGLVEVVPWEGISRLGPVRGCSEKREGIN